MSQTTEPRASSRRTAPILIPTAILAAGTGIAIALHLLRPTPTTETPTAFAPLVEYVELQPTTARLDVTAFGTVRPRTATALVAEVTARVVKVSASLEAGGFFDEGDLLVEFDRRDYDLTRIQAEGQVADAQLALSLERAEAESAVEEWHATSDAPAPELVQRLPQLASARARVRSAEAAVDAAKLDLERTTVLAPYTGRVREKHIDIGQFVSRGAPVAEIYSIDSVEIRLPLPDRDLEFLDLPIQSTRRGSAITPATGHDVTIRAEFAGAQHEWMGQVVRTEGVVGEQNRMVYAVARVRDPYGRGATYQNGGSKPGDATSAAERPPLLIGMFVEATIAGREVIDVFMIPRESILGGDRVLVIREDETLALREIDILRVRHGVACVRRGLAAGERLCTTRLDIFTDGMKVRIAGADDPQSTEAGTGIEVEAEHDPKAEAAEDSNR